MEMDIESAIECCEDGKSNHNFIFESVGTDPYKLDGYIYCTNCGAEGKNYIKQNVVTSDEGKLLSKVITAELEKV